MSDAGPSSIKVPREMRALAYLAAASLALIVWIARPVAVGLFIGALLAFTLQPLYGRLRSRHIRARPAALICSLGAMAVVTALMVGLLTLFVTRGISLVTSLPRLLAPESAFQQRAAQWMRAVHVEPTVVSEKLREGAMAIGAEGAALGADAAGATFDGFLLLLFMGLATYFVLVHWHDVLVHAENMLPFEPRHTHALLEQFRIVGRQVLRGTVVTGVVQGAFAAVGYWVTGVPDPAFFGALTAGASLVPAVGTMLVWIPVGIYLIATGHPGAGAVELVYATLVVVGVPDYVIRPRLVGSEKGVPAIFTFVSLFGGVEVFGLIGLVLGPILVTIALAILRTYDAEIRKARGT